MVLRAQQQGRQQAEDAQRRVKEILRTTKPTSNQGPNAPKSCDKANLGSVKSSEDKNDLASRISQMTSVIRFRYGQHPGVWC